MSNVLSKSRKTRSVDDICTPPRVHTSEDQTEKESIEQDNEGITLEQLRRRPLAQKLSDLDALDWRSQVLSESRKDLVDEGICMEEELLSKV